MEQHKDDERENINCEKPLTMEEDEAAAGSANARILVKLKIPKIAEETVAEKEQEEKATPTMVAVEEIMKTHYCKECNKNFSSGKALGGHMSSAHVQANKDYTYKKLSSKIKRPHKDSGAPADNSCGLCGKIFRSKKSLFGHMRCHPEREWRGMEPPRAGPNQDQEDEDNQIDSDPVARIGCDLKGWPKVVKRGRGGPMNPAVRARGSSSEEKETFVAGHQLIRLLKGDSGARHGPEFDGGDICKKQKLDSGVGKVRIREPVDAIDDATQLKKKPENINKGKEKAKLDYNNKGKGKASEIFDRDDLESEDELYLTAIEVLMNGKMDKLENEKKIMEETVCLDGESEKSSPVNFICNICERSFGSHQALGGHRSSHNKFKLNIVNTADRSEKPDRREKASKEKGQRRRKVKAAGNGGGVGGDNNVEVAEKVVLGFDLNEVPEEEEEKEDGDGESSYQTSNNS